MTTVWPMAPLSRALRQVEDVVHLDGKKQYKQVTVSMHGGGLRLRRLVMGADVKTKRQYRVRAGQFVYSRLDARNGAFGLVPPELDGAVVSSDFPVFDVEASVADSKFIAYLTRSRWFIAQCEDPSRGVTNRQRMAEARLLSLVVPLPAIDEQHRIVERIDAVATRVAEAHWLRESVDDEREELLWTMAHGGTAASDAKQRMGWTRVALADVMRPGVTPIRVERNKQYASIGMYSFGRGAFHKPPVDGADLKATTLYRVKAGQFIYAKLCAFEGTFGVVPDDADGACVSNEFPAFDCDPRRVFSEFLFCYFKAPHIWDELDRAIRGFGGRRFRLKPEHLLAYRIWLPPPAYQESVVKVYRQTERLRRAQTMVADELESVMPALLDRTFRGEM